MDTIGFKAQWFANPKWWFSKEPVYDEHITRTYGHLLEGELQTGHDVITTILVLDQLPRHVYRNTASAHIIEYYLQQAIRIVERYLNGDFMNTLTTPEWMFFLLPLRHSKQLNKIFMVMKLAWKRMKTHGLCEWLKKFTRATYLNCPTEDQFVMLDSAPSTIVDNKIFLDTFTDIWATDCNCELVEPPNLDVIGKHEAYSRNKLLIVSLSGGVDSMVLLMMMKQLYPDNRIVAVHINYCNRDTSDKEAQFVKAWCAKYDVPCFVRNIREIQRKPCMDIEMRDVYESYTKNVRFGSYKSVAKMYGADECTVFMGHNKDDCFENILTNMTFKSKYENLCGMSHSSVQEGVRFVRPLLDVPKHAIISAAQEHGIPYLYDSTSRECQRGMIRDRVVPVLQGWHSDAIPGMFAMAGVMKELYDVLKMSVKTFVEAFVDAKQKVLVDSLSETTIYWKQVFIAACGEYISNKSLKSFVDSVKQLKKNFRKMDLHSVNKMVLNKRLMVECKKLVNDSVEFKLVLIQ